MSITKQPHERAAEARRPLDTFGVPAPEWIAGLAQELRERNAQLESVPLLDPASQPRDAEHAETFAAALDSALNYRHSSEGVALERLGIAYQACLLRHEQRGLGLPEYLELRREVALRLFIARKGEEQE